MEIIFTGQIHFSFSRLTLTLSGKIPDLQCVYTIAHVRALVDLYVQLRVIVKGQGL